MSSLSYAQNLEGLPRPEAEVAISADSAALHAHRKHMRELRPGLHLHYDDICEPQSVHAHAEIFPGLRIVLLLEGALDLSYGDRDVRLAATVDKPCACLVSVAEADQFTRRAQRGAYSRRVNLGLEFDWMDQVCASSQERSRTLDTFRCQHLATMQWQLSARGVALAEQIVRPLPMEPLLQSLYLECRSLELVTEAMGTLHAQAQGGVSDTHDLKGLRPREHQRVRELHALLSSGQADAMSMDDIARQAGVNANTLQRQFRAVYGTTIFDHLRESRLLRARQALELEGVTVGQAAMIAGYTSAANFATAYRRRFGTPPKLVRTRV